MSWSWARHSEIGAMRRSQALLITLAVAAAPGRTHLRRPPRAFVSGHLSMLLTSRMKCLLSS
eukprot:3119321-Alexandrium_andersonii.AAC.1